MEPIVPSVFDELEQSRPLVYASTGQRFVHYIVDLIVCYLFISVLWFIFGMLSGFNDGGWIMFFTEKTPGSILAETLINSVILIATYSIIEGVSKGRTLGKLLTGTQVVKEDGTEITWKDAFKRSLCRLIPFEPFSGFGGHPWHDTITGTVVIKTRGYF